MRILNVVAVLMLVTATSVTAQRGSLNPFVTYNWGGSVPVVGGDIKIVASEAYGATLDIAVRPGAKAQLLYSYQPTQADFRPFTGLPEKISDLKVHYMHIGGMAEIPKDKLRLLGGASAGATLFHPSDQRYSDEWSFSFRFFLGAKLMFSERVGLHAKGELLLPIQWAGICIGCGGGAGVTAGTTIVQGVVGGGLTIAF